MGIETDGPCNLSAVSTTSEAAAQDTPFSYIFASELLGRLRWFASLRWIAAVALAISSLAAPGLGMPGAWPSLAIVAGVVALYNLLFSGHLRRLSEAEHPYANLRTVAIVHMLTDIGALLAVVHFTGGCRSPVLPFMVFHMAIGTIMISTRIMFLIAGTTCSASAVLFAFEHLGILESHAVLGAVARAPASACALSGAMLVVLLFGVVYLTDSVTSRFKQRNIALFRTSEKLRLRGEELQRLIEEMEEAERKKSHYMRISAHQLRSPLGTIKTSLQVLVDGYLDAGSDQGRRLLAGASERVDDLLAIVNDLLELAKMREGRAQAPWARNFFVNQLIADIFDAITPLARSRGIELVPDFRGVALLDWGVPPDLVYVFENLIHNAIVYSHEGGAVRVTLTVEDDIARVVVADEGIGIPVELQEEVFLEFVRAPNAKDHTAGGTGLGLSIVREGVEMHGGEVTIDSSAGEGTRVTVTLPLHYRPPEIEERGS
jgi:signal transduction histidine kinase